MTANLTEEQIRALEEHPDRPLQMFDPKSKRFYTLVRSEIFENLRGLLDQEFRPADAYAAIDRAFAEGWEAPGMDDYDRYEEFKR